MDPATILALSLMTMDYAQTRTIADNPQKYEERNPILGKHPSIGRVNTYFLASEASFLALHYTLPEKYGKYHAYFVIGMEGYCVTNNLRIGVHMTF